MCARVHAGTCVCMCVCVFQGLLNFILSPFSPAAPCPRGYRTGLRAPWPIALLEEVRRRGGGCLYVGGRCDGWPAHTDVLRPNHLPVSGEPRVTDVSCARQGDPANTEIRKLVSVPVCLRRLALMTTTGSTPGWATGFMSGIPAGGEG